MDAVDAHLSRRRFILFPGESYDLTDDVERLLAAEWLAEQVTAVLKEMGW